MHVDGICVHKPGNHNPQLKYATYPQIIPATDATPKPRKNCKPNALPILADNPKIYPYFKFEEYTHKPEKRDWKVVTLENEFIKVFILPEIGGKVWGAIEKSTGEEFLYKNEVIKKNSKTLLKLNSNGAQIVFVSARPEKNQKKLMIELKKIGFSNFKLLLGLNHSQRILINDYYLTNPNPSAVSINIARDNENLNQLIQSL